METESGFDRDVWRMLCVDLGLVGVDVSGTHGGAGAGSVELGIALEEMGRALLCAPYFATAVLGAGAIRHAGTDAERRALLPPLIAGDRLATLAITEPDGCWDVGADPAWPIGRICSGTSSP